MDDATFGIFPVRARCRLRRGCRSPEAAADVEATAAAGFTMFTIDPSEHVDDSVGKASSGELRAKFDKLAGRTTCPVR